MGLFEFLMLCCFGFSWPFSIAKSLRSKSGKGKSLGFMLLIEGGRSDVSLILPGSTVSYSAVKAQVLSKG